MKSQNAPKSLYEIQLQTIIKWFRVSLKMDLKVPKHVKLYDKLWIFFQNFPSAKYQIFTFNSILTIVIQFDPMDIG